MTQTKKIKQTNRFALATVFAVILILLLIAGLLATALLSYHATDPAWSHSSGSTVQNALGVVGAWYSDISFSLLGKLSYLLPIAVLAFAVHAWFEKGIDKELLSWRLVMLMTAILSGCVLLTKHDPQVINSVAQTGGGALGAWLTIGLEKSIKSIPVIMGFSLVVFIVSLSLLFNFPWLKVTEWVGKRITAFFALLFAGFAYSKTKKQKTPTMTANVDEAPIADEALQDKMAIVNQMTSLAAESEAVNEESTSRPTFTIDRYQPEETVEEIVSAPTEKPSRRTLDNASSVDLSYFGIRDESKEKITINQGDDTLTTTTTNQPMWDQSVVEEKVAIEIPAPIIQKETNNSHSPTRKPERSEPSLFDLGRLKATSIKRSAMETMRSNKVRQDFDNTDVSNQIVENMSLSGKQSWVNATSSTDSLTNNIKPIDLDLNDIPLAPINFDDAGVQDVIEPTSGLQESLKGGIQSTKQVDGIAETMTRPTVQEASKETPMATQPITPPIKPTVKPAVKPKTNATIGSAYNTQETRVSVAEQPYELPSVNLLDTPPSHTNSYTEDMLADMALVLETTLKQFNVSATVMHVSPGPVITRFEIDLAPGIQAKKITNLSQDLARALAVSRVRVEEVIVGSSYVGLEVPNKSRETVYFKDVVCSKPFQDSKSPLTVSLGSDTSGKPVVADLMKMPHALVAGTTGSGKSVCINVMLLSMLYKASPKDLRLILVDPKMLEMSMYEDIPHLLTPVITDMNEAENALTWAVAEMERRYQLMSALKVRKIDAFNEQIDAANARGEPIKDPLWEPNESIGYTHHPTLERLPFIVIVIDELADMMMVVGKQVEQLIARLTQKARAAGIHVVLATQRPSTDVLTGLIKANVPTRIAFQVSSGTDSRVIIDGVGAEKLLGHGDMLYVPPGASHPQRLHGAFVGDAETDRVTNFLRSMGEPDYIAGITTKQDPETLGAFGAAEAAESKDDADPLYEEAVQIVLETGKASISSVQRQLRIGYNRAARMIEDMQEQGIVSAPVNGVRKVLGISHLNHKP